jgi:hypothetical protein
MPSIISLATKLQADFPAFTFVSDTGFRWSPDEKVILYDQASEDLPSLLHELSHAILDHKRYTRDIQLIELERDAWRYARDVLAVAYSVAIDTNQVEDALDTYRDWLHARSVCPGCRATGVQTGKNEYKCIICITTWRVNDARICALRRYKTNK